MASILEMAKNYTTHTAEMLVKDTGYIPADKLSWSAMGCAKTAANILVECGTANIAIASAILGKPVSREELEAKGKAVEAEGTHEALKKFVEETTAAVCTMIDSLSEADLAREATMPWGMKLPIAQAIFLPAEHMTYHDGQINYIQLLLGDDKFHWAE